MRTTKDVDLEKLKAALGLEPASDSPYKRQEYFLTRPSPWLANLRRIAPTLMPSPPASRSSWPSVPSTNGRW